MECEAYKVTFAHIAHTAAAVRKIRKRVKGWTRSMYAQHWCEKFTEDDIEREMGGKPLISEDCCIIS